MALVITLIIVLFILWRVKKKKARKVQRAAYQTQQQVQADPTLGPVIPPSRPQLRGTPVTENSFPKKRKQIYTAADHFGALEPGGPEDPDLAFACTKYAFEEVTRNVKSISIALDEDSSCCRALRWGVRLAQFYRDGHGCDPDAQAAIDVMDKIDFLWARVDALVGSRALNPRESQAAHAVLGDSLENQLCYADCCSMLGDGDRADTCYRESFHMAQAIPNADYWREKVIRHAMGDYSTAYPRPVRYGVAVELALSLAGLKKPMGGHYLMALMEIRNLDLNALGHSWEKDLSLYSSAEGAYPLYRTGLALLHGLGTAQDVKAGLTALAEAYRQGNIMAAEALYEYYDGIRYSDRLNAQQKALVEKLLTEWSGKYKRMKADPSTLEKIMSTGTVNEAAAAFSSQYRQPERSEDGEAAEGGDIHDMPQIITDDMGRPWVFVDWVGSEARRYRPQYQTDSDSVLYPLNTDADGNTEVIIRQSHIHGNTASLFSRTFHW